jgi:outer membrane protein assembly factor BamE
MRPLSLIFPLLVVTGCSSVNLPISPYKIDVQQGNVLEQDAVEKLRTGMTRSQVRFLLGTPLVVDPFRTDRWDYVYSLRKSGTLKETKRLTLIFKGDLLDQATGEGIVVPTLAVLPAPASVAPAVPAPVVESPEQSAAADPAPAPGFAPVGPVSMGQTGASSAVAAQSPSGAARAEETDPQKREVLDMLDAWMRDWAARDIDAYMAHYSPNFKPEQGLSRAEWEKRRRLLLGVSRNIEVRIDEPLIDFPAPDVAVLAFNQVYRSANHQDKVVKQLRLARVNGRWMITEENVLSVVKER